MSENWAENYIQDKLDKKKKLDMAASGAESIFQKIRERIQEDLRVFYKAGMFHGLTAEDAVGGRFRVSSSDTLPHCSLIMELSVVLLKYNYTFEKNGQPTPRSGTLKICSNLGGDLQVFKDGELIGIESELSSVSKFLLLPLLQHIEA